MKYFSNFWISVLSLSSVLNKLLAFAFFVFLARVVSAEDYGSFRYILTIATFFIIPFSGIPFALTRYVSKNFSNQELSSKYLFNSILLGFFAVTPVLFITAYIYDDALVLNLIIVSMAIDAFYIAFANAYLIYTKMTFYKVLTNFIQLFLLLILFLFEKLNLFIVFLVFSISGLISIFFLEITHKKTTLMFEVSKTKLSKLFLFSLPASAGAIGWTLMFGINAIWIKYFYDLKDFAYFSAGETFAQIFAIVPSVFAAILLPKSTKFLKRQETKKPLYQSIFITISCSLLFVVPFVVMPEFIIKITFGDNYLKTAGIILPLIFAIIFISIHTLYAQAMFAFNKVNFPMYSMFFGSVINCLIGFFLTKKFGINGTAFSLMFSCFLSLAMLSCIYHFLFLKRASNEN